MDILEKFTQKNIYILRRIGIVLAPAYLDLFTVGKKTNKVNSIAYNEIQEIEIRKGHSKDYGSVKWYEFKFSIFYFGPQPNASQCYNLVIHLKIGKKVVAEIIDFDLIITTKLIAKLNESIKLYADKTK
ncbi:hypothetical protein [Crocinitomix catalasitica]|uniref:hypothetical protein n=1 Tax=Crocinitomix catalasitica TaxID=184607 RepID=UPI00047FECE8|nr:hypothetical protein [Crocinitomix catalasitica]